MPLQLLGGYRCQAERCQGKSYIASSKVAILIGTVPVLIIVAPAQAGATELKCAISAAALNFGDCFAYEMAKENGCPLLYVGDDFAKTDLVGVG
jgi:uncharacterized protein with PIN domain